MWCDRRDLAYFGEEIDAYWVVRSHTLARTETSGLPDGAAALDQECAAYCERIMEMPEMVEWVEAARLEPDEIEEFEAEF